MSTILVVDDVTANRQVLVTLLEHQGHRVLEAGNGSQGLAVVAAEKPDLVITDVLMPIMDGYEFVRQLRRDPETGTIPVVFYTAHYGAREARAFALSSGVAFVLAKPVQADELVDVILRALSGETEPGVPPAGSPLPTEFDREHLRLLTAQAAAKDEDVRNANARLRALINIGMELAAEGDAERLLRNVCSAARDLFGATYVTLGILDPATRTLQRLIVEGPDAPPWIGIGDDVPGVLRIAVTERRTVRGHNVGGDPAALHLPPGHPPIHAFLAAPVTSPAHPYGWICLVGNEGWTFTEEDEALLGALSGQVGRIYESGHFHALVKQERDRAQQTLDTAEVILLSLDVEDRITQVNRYGCSILGWTEAELLGRDWIDTCVPAGSRSAVRKTLADVLAGDLSIVENPIMTRSGDERFIEWRNTLLRDSGGRVIGTFSSGTDITNRTRMDKQLLLQGAALNAAANAILITDRDGLIEWLNPAFSALSGYTPAEALGRNSSELVQSGRHGPELYTQLWDTVLSGQVWRGEMINRRKDGSEYLEEQSITPFRDLHGEIAHFIAVKEDISERRRGEDAARERAQLSALGAAVGLTLTECKELDTALQGCAEAFVSHLEASAVHVWVLNDQDGTLELHASAGHGLATAATCAPVKIALGESAIGRIAANRTAYLTNSVGDDLDAADQAWARGQGVIAFAGYPLIVDHRVAGVLAISARRPLSDPVRTKLASLGNHLALGIERLRTMRALQEAEERMRFALQSADVGIWDMDYVTGVLRWSEILEAHYGLEPGTFAGTSDAFLERVHPDDRQAVSDTIQKAMKSGADFTMQHRTVWPDNSIRWLNGAGRILLGAHGEPVRGVGISLDITARRTLEEQFQQAQKMEAVGRLAGGIAHDFNNLLNVILGFCELLLADRDQDDPQYPDLVEIHKAGSRAAELTRQLLAFSRKQIIEPVLLDLNVVVGEMRTMLVRLIGADVAIGLRFAPGLPPVRADRGQVEQIVMNLAVNARDAMPDGGALTIETAAVELDEDYGKTHLAVKPGPYVRLTVTDTGTGMTPEVQARLFEPFFTTKGPGRGTGLGMAIVYGIATRGGGSVGVYSEVGRGTSFKVYFPKAEGAGMPAPPPAATTPTRGTETIVIVEDADAVRELARRLLAQQGYTVLVAANADEARRLFEDHPTIDVLLTDVVMPGDSGPALSRQLVQQRPQLKVIYMSGYTEDAIVQHGVLNPGIAFLNKPFTAATLGAKIREVLDR